MYSCSRKPAIVILAASLLAAGAYVRGTRAEADHENSSSLRELEVAIANPDAGLETWLLYAQRLQEDRRFAHAAMAYQRVLESDPYSRTANLQCALAYALAGDAAGLHAFVTHLLLIDPRLAVDILTRPETQPFQTAESFQRLLTQARAQALD
jgi:tetratricopeptide (TPR) repeat protein